MRPGWYAVSLNGLVGGINLSAEEYEALERFRFLEGLEPVAEIGTSILLYRIP